MSRASFVEAEAKVFADWSLVPRTRELRLQKPRMSVQVAEVGDGEPTLFLHGFSLCSAHFAPLISRLPSVRSIALDMPGHGQSDAVDFRGVNLRSWFKDMLIGCLDELGLESVHVVGHSQGAMIGMWLALDAPERVRSLVAIGTPAVALGANVDGLRFLARPVTGPLIFAMPKSTRTYRGILASTIGAGAVEAASVDLIRATYLGSRPWGFATTVSSYLREMFRGVDAVPQRYALTDNELTSLRPPVLVVWGKEEGTQPLDEVKARVALIPNGRFELVPGGHEPWLDDLDSSAEAVSSFLAHSQAASQYV